MSPASSSGSPPAAASNSTGSCLVVAWDLDTTGRRLIDEICQIGAYAVIPHGSQVQATEPEEGADDTPTSASSESLTFSQYVMPNRNPNPGARRSFGIKVVNVGRYRMLKDMATGKILKTKSEVSALQDFIEWLEECRVKAKKDGGVLLACHEMTRKFLVPLLLEAVHKYQLFDQFQATVKGFVNGVHVVEKLGSKDVITSYSLRSLCKTVLGDTNPDTNSASDRSEVLIQILAKVTSGTDENSTTAAGAVDSSQLASVVTSVQEEVGQLKDLKGMLDTQSSLRPIFEARLKQKKRSVRDRAMTLRKLVAESGLDFKAVQDAFTAKTEGDGDGEGALKEVLKAKIPDAVDEDVDDLAEIVREYFCVDKPAAGAKPKAVPVVSAAVETVAEDNADNGEADEGDQVVEEVVEASIQVVQEEAPPATRPAGRPANGGHYNQRGRGYHHGYHRGRGGHHYHNGHHGYHNSYNQNYYHRPRGGYHSYHNQQQHYNKRGYSKPYRGGHSYSSGAAAKQENVAAKE